MTATRKSDEDVLGAIIAKAGGLDDGGEYVRRIARAAIAGGFRRRLPVPPLTELDLINFIEFLDSERGRTEFGIQFETDAHGAKWPTHEDIVQAYEATS